MGNEGKADLERPYLLRSYDHFFKTSSPKRRRSGTGTNPSFPAPLNPGAGTSFAAWKVARAATAAKLYFKPFEVALDDGEVLKRRRTLFRARQSSITTGQLTGIEYSTHARASEPRPTALLSDAGFGPSNNPSEEVHRELTSILSKRAKKISTWVSIGTARKMSSSAKTSLRDVVKQAINEVGNPEPVHESIKQKSRAPGNNGFAYFRLNDPDGLHVDMDEWEPKGVGEQSGSKTIKKITGCYTNWAAQTENVNMLRACAERLVRIRRARGADKSLWERYALGKFYTCDLNDCKYDCDETWHYRDTFLQHLKTDHKVKDAKLEHLLRQCEWLWEYKPRR